MKTRRSISLIDMSTWNMKIFFDGACPLCMREQRFLERLNKKCRLVFVDTSVPGFDPKIFGISTDTDRVIHAQLADGTIIKGLEVFRNAYREVGLGFLLAPTGWPVLKPIFDRLYLIFARNRKKITRLLGRKCDTNLCE